MGVCKNTQFCKQYCGFVCDVRFAMDAEVHTAVQKAFWAIPAEEFEKTMMQKWQERMQKCIFNRSKY